MLGKMSSTTRILEECELEERRANLSMIEEKARALLSRNERHALLRSCHAYASHQIHVDSFVDTLHQLLCTPSKVKFFFFLFLITRVVLFVTSILTGKPEKLENFHLYHKKIKILTFKTRKFDGKLKKLKNFDLYHKKIKILTFKSRKFDTF